MKDTQWYKQIVSLLIRTNEKRLQRIRSGKASDFDKMAAKAIEDAKENVNLDTDIPELRAEILKKCIMSIEDQVPYERAGETYCARGTFYAYRKRLIKLIALNMGIIQEEHGKNTVLRRRNGAGKGKA